MRQVQHGLRDTLELRERQLVEQQRHQDGHRRADNEVQQVQDDCVLQRIDKVLIVECLDEPFPAAVFRPIQQPRRFQNVVLLERQQNIGHGNVAEDDEERQRYEQQQIQCAVSLQVRSPPHGGTSGQIPADSRLGRLQKDPFFPFGICTTTNIVHLVLLSPDYTFAANHF